MFIMQQINLIMLISGMASVGALPLIGWGNNDLPEGKRSPVIFVPGTGGSQLQAKVNRASNSSDPCPTQLDWHRIWLDLWRLRPTNLECWVRNMKMQVDPVTGRTRDAEGVSSYVGGWGTLDTIDYLDPSWQAFLLGNIGAYFKPMSDVLRKWGYTDKKDLRGAPYDFRYLPDYNDFVSRLGRLVEDMYEHNEQTKITLLAHSLGGRFALSFLQRQSQGWKDKYIHAFITMGTPWAGTATEHTLFSYGYSFGIPSFLVNPRIIREQAITQDTNVLLLPSPSGFSSDDILLKTPRRNYTVNDYEDFFADVGYPIGFTRLNETRMQGFRSNSPGPGVPTHCLYGKGVTNTVKTTVFKNHDFSEEPTVLYGDGDGTVNLESLTVCSQWDPSITTLKAFDKVDHKQMLDNQGINDYIKSVIFYTSEK